MTEDNVSDLTVEILRTIQSDIADLRGEVSELRSDVAGVRGDMATKVELAELRQEMRDGFSAVRADFHRLEDASIAGFTGVRAAIDHTNAQLARLIVAAGTRFRRLERRR